MKRTITILLVLVLALALAACGDKSDDEETRMEGSYYQIIDETVSLVQVFEYAGDTLCSMALSMGNHTSYLDGYLSQGAVFGGVIRFTYHVTSNVGDFISDDTDEFYVYYYPADDTVEIIVGDTVFEFSK